MGIRNQYSVPDNIRVKARANYTCERCGSTRMVQAHAPNRDHTDWRKGIALCAECHSKEHPDVPRNLFFTRNNQPYWPNISAGELAKEFSCHTRTVIRHAKKLGLSTRVDLTDDDKLLLRGSICRGVGIGRPTLLSKDVMGQRNAEIARLFDNGRGLTLRQIAEKLGMNISAVSMVIKRWNDKLKKGEQG